MARVIRSDWLLVLLSVLAVARLTVLVNDDYVLQPMHAWVTERVDDARRSRRWADVQYLLGCPWCVSIWAGGAVAGLVYPFHDYWPVQVGLLLLAASYVTGLLAETRQAVTG